MGRKSLRLCSSCLNRHKPPYGLRCRANFGSLLEPFSDEMDLLKESGLASKMDPKYIAYLEDKIKSTGDDSGEEDGPDRKMFEALSDIQKRLDRIEKRPPKPEEMGVNVGDSVTPILASQQITDLSSSLQQLSLASGMSAKKGIELRPAYHIQVIISQSSLKEIDHTKLSTSELLYGMMLVEEHLRFSGQDTAGYHEHMLFVSRHAIDSTFSTLGLVMYDHSIVDGVLAKKHDFGYIDSIASGIYLHGYYKKSSDRPQQYGYRGERRGSGQRPSGRAPFMSQGQPGGYSGENRYSEEICLRYNNAGCFTYCTRKHACSVCGMRGHGAYSCYQKAMSGKPAGGT